MPVVGAPSMARRRFRVHSGPGMTLVGVHGGSEVDSRLQGVDKRVFGAFRAVKERTATLLAKARSQ